jgi:hypothetical protein
VRSRHLLTTVTPASVDDPTDFEPPPALSRSESGIDFVSRSHVHLITARVLTTMVAHSATSPQTGAVIRPGSHNKTPVVVVTPRTCAPPRADCRVYDVVNDGGATICPDLFFDAKVELPAGRRWRTMIHHCHRLNRHGAGHPRSTRQSEERMKLC